jgi:hypothetical protein
MGARSAFLIGFGIFGVNRLQRAEWADLAHACRQRPLCLGRPAVHAGPQAQARLINSGLCQY